MQGFLAQTAARLYEKYGDGISSLYLLFPSRRAELFFGEALAALAGKPIWQPHTTSIDELMGLVAGQRAGDRVRLITELYKVWSRYHTEDFDSFYYWGEMLLADFDAVDKYLIDAGMLFANLSDIKQMDADRTYLTPAQRQIIDGFWESFSLRSGVSTHQEEFLKVWNTLAAVYNEYKTALAGQQSAYTGMMHRTAAELLHAGGLPAQLAERRYAVIGFNALTECEKKLFDALRKAGNTDFFWDRDHYWLDNAQHEAGLFMRGNLQRYPDSAPLSGGYDNFRQDKKITVVQAPSDTLQCKYLYRLLETLGAPGKETAVVLADETLLDPVLGSMPANVGSLNVTMGYPLRQTLVYSFTERLLELQRRAKDGRFYHSDAVGLLQHPFLMETAGTAPLVKHITGARIVWPGPELLAENGLLRAVFTLQDGWQALGAYLVEILSDVAHGPGAGGDPMRAELLTLTCEHIIKLCNSLRDCGVELSTRTFASLLRSQLQGVRIPYEGEPLEGLQVMGFLETRALDFENVVILSTADDRLPGNLSPAASFIPHNLRTAYGLPTPQHHEAMYAYYFYRLLSRAKHVYLVYCSMADDRRRGEPSRYIYQIEYESPHEIEKQEVALDANLSRTEPVTVVKTPEVMELLGEFLTPGGRKLSPTAFSAYVVCPLRFYFRSVARLDVPEEMAEQVDPRLLGTILHRAMEYLYTPFSGRDAPQIKPLVNSPAVGDAVHRAIEKEFLSEGGAQSYGGQLQLVARVVERYINKGILAFDTTQPGVKFEGLERHLESSFAFPVAGRELTVYFAGTADRVDRLPGGLLRVVDYKTGRVGTGSLVMEFRDVDSLFYGAARAAGGAAIQTLLYAMMLSRAGGGDVQPAVYAVRHMHEAGYSPLFMDRTTGAPVLRYSDYAPQFEQVLGEILGAMFDPAVPFAQCEDEVQCQYCDFRSICGRVG